jgi:hypothetical protein
MVDWWWIQRSVANIDEGCYWSVLDCGKGEWSMQLPQGFLCTKVAFSNLGNADSHFHVGDPHLVCNCRSALKCVEIFVRVMPVLAKECSALSLYELFDFRCEFVMLPQSQFIANVMHVTVPVKPLLMCQTD